MDDEDEKQKYGKITRILIMYSELLQGRRIEKDSICLDWRIGERTFERDILELRLFLSETREGIELLYDRENNNYYLSKVKKYRELSAAETGALMKILQGYRSLRKDEFVGMIGSLAEITETRNQEYIRKIEAEVKNDYTEANHGQALLKMYWDLQQCILEKKKIRLRYRKRTEEYVNKEVYPVDIQFSESYFYLLAYLAGEEYEYPAFFRLDRIYSFQILREEYREEILEQYKKINIRKYLKYMQGGEILQIKLRCKNECKKDLEEAFQEVKVLKDGEEETVMEVRAFQDGFVQWALGQGEKIVILEPEELKMVVKHKLEAALEKYQYVGGQEDGKKNKVSLGDERWSQGEVT